MDLKSAPTSFFIATANAEACERFYSGVLGLKLVSNDQFALVYELADSELRISKVPAFSPHPFTVLDWQVADIEAAHGALSVAGIEPVVFDGMGQDAKGIWTVPGAGVRIIWFRDPDQNLLSVSQRA